MLASRLVRSGLAAAGGSRRAAAAATAAVAGPGTCRGFAAARSSADEFAYTAAAGARQPGEDEGGMKIQSELPDIGGYGDDPVAAGAEAKEAAEGAMEETREATEGAVGEVAEAASGAVGAAEAARSGVREAASAASGVVHAAAEPVKPQAHPLVDDAGNMPARGEAPGTSGHAMSGWPRWKKEADDAMLGGTPEPGVVLE